MTVYTLDTRENGMVKVYVATNLGTITAYLPADRRQAIQVLQVLTDELPGAVDRALGEET